MMLTEDGKDIDDGSSQSFIHRWWFGFIVSTTIAINAVQLGLETDYPEFQTFWLVLENVVTFIFVVELICKLCVLRKAFFRDTWNWVDFVLTLAAVIDTWILSSMETNVGAATVIRALRLFRLLRMLKLFQRFRQFMLVIAGVIDAAKCCVWVSLVLAVTIYAFAIFSVRILGHESAELYPGYTSAVSEIEESGVVQSFNPYVSFGTMPRAMLTLLNVALLDGWSDIAVPMLMYQPWLLPMFILFVLFVTLGVMNVIIGMICDSVLSKAEEMQRNDQVKIRNAKLHLLERIQGLPELIDSNEDGKVDAEELKTAIQDNPEVRKLIESIDLPEGFSAEELVLLLNSSGDGLLSYDNFIRSFYRLIEGGDFQQLCLMQMNINAIKQHILQMKEDSKKSQEVLASRLEQLEERLLGGQSVSPAPHVALAGETVPREAATAATTATTTTKMPAAAVAAAAPATTLVPPPPSPVMDVADEFFEPSDEAKYPDVGCCTQWQQTLANLEDATAATQVKLSHYVEQVSAALEELENVRASMLPPPRSFTKNSPASMMNSPASMRLQSVATDSKGQSRYQSVAQRLPSQRGFALFAQPHSEPNHP